MPLPDSSSGDGRRGLGRWVWWALLVIGVFLLILGVISLFQDAWARGSFFVVVGISQAILNVWQLRRPPGRVSRS